MKILIIEDDEMLNRALKAGLEREGYSVDTIADGEQGEKRLALHHDNYDVAILDLTLPGKEGDEICKSIRSKKITIPILILTGKVSTEDKVRLLNAGADDYLTKPFSLQELIARIRALLRRPQPLLSNKLEVGDFMLDLTTRKAYRNGREIDLTLKEFAVLEYLMRHPNQVIIRDQILDHVWDFNFSSFSNIVDVHVSKLRKKINMTKGDDVLETVRGVGYRFKP